MEITNAHPIKDVRLTPDERLLLDQIAFDPDGPDDCERNGQLIGQLLRSLMKRDGIPEARLKFFTDPRYCHGGRGKSYRDLFHQNGRSDDEILKHPHFLPFIRYFLFGDELPNRVREAFCREVESIGNVTSSDVVPLGRLARSLARDAGLTGSDAAEEFFKLAMEQGLGLDYASSIYEQVRRLR
jgi:hypothetical protein